VEFRFFPDKILTFLSYGIRYKGQVLKFRKIAGRTLGREALLLAIPILALVAFGFISLRWEKRAQEEEVRARCLALAEPLRREFFARLGKVDNLREGALYGDIDTLPIPGEDSDSLARFIKGEYQTVLGEAGTLSETGLPLRPLAAIRLVRTEEDPKRLEELTRVIAAEPSFITAQLLREAEGRHEQLGLPVPPVLNGWEDGLERSTRVHRILSGQDPADLLSASENLRWLQSEDEPMLMIRAPYGPALIDQSALHDIIGASRSTIANALPAGISAEIILGHPVSGLLTEIAIDSGHPAIHFVIVDVDAVDRLSGRRRGFFVSFLVIAAVLSGIGILVLLQSVARERELAERKGNLVAAVSHEMRTPVASIRLLAENLSTGAANTKERRAKHLGQLLEQSERLSTLVENVLSYSKRVAGRAPCRMAPVEVSGLLRDSATHFEALAESRKVSLRWSVGEFCTTPEGDARALGQALINLIDNALKHSPANSELLFGAHPVSDRIDGWCLWVSDAGPGVPKEMRRKVFEAFYRVGPELRRETKGTGLGLALVQKVAESHGGEALCCETDSSGARFEIHLPYTPPNQKKPEQLKRCLFS